MAKEILIADSDKADQQEFQKIFKTTDYHLIFSESGEDALLRAKLFKPDMIIASGAGLQEKGGLELCGAIKGDPDIKQIPFILISSIFDEISEKERKRFQADGVISKPLNEGEVLDLVGNLMEGEAVGKRGEMASEKQEFMLDETGEGEEEIIELVDVVEEPEPRMSIDSFVPTGREKSITDATSLDSWEKMDFEEKTLQKELTPPPEKKIGGTELRVKRKVPLKEAPPEEELFDKIELEEILGKVEELRPSLEKEWPSEIRPRGAQKRPVSLEEPAGNLDLSGFEAMLRKEAKAAVPRQEPRPLPVEAPQKRIPEETILTEKWEKEPVEEPIRESLEESPGEEPIEEALEASFEEPIEESLEASLQEHTAETPGESIVESPDEFVEVEELKDLDEEEFPDELLEDILGEEEIGIVAKAKGLEPAEVMPEKKKAEEIAEIEEIEEKEEIEAIEEVKEAGPFDRMEELERAEKIEEIKVDRLEEVEAPRAVREGAPSLVMEVSKQMQEAISQKVQEMMEEMMTKLVPEMTQNVVGLTLDRIEKMVKEVVPDLAEKAIQEEIKRLQKGEKE